MIFYNDIDPEYEITRDSLEATFPEAYTFLEWIESLEDKGFHIGTKINLHLYYKDKFLLYFKKDSSTQIVISSKPNVHIKQGAHVDNKSLFLLWLDILKKLNLERNKGIRINKNKNFTITMIKSPDSQKLFETLRKTIKFIPQAR